MNETTISFEAFVLFAGCCSSIGSGRRDDVPGTNNGGSEPVVAMGVANDMFWRNTWYDDSGCTYGVNLI